MPDCGCRIGGHKKWIIYCPMHAAAAEMMRLLERESKNAQHGECPCAAYGGPCNRHAEIDRLLIRIKEADNA